MSFILAGSPADTCQWLRRGDQVRFCQGLHRDWIYDDLKKMQKVGNLIRSDFVRRNNPSRNPRSLDFGQEQISKFFPSEVFSSDPHRQSDRHCKSFPWFCGQGKLQEIECWGIYTYTDVSNAIRTRPCTIMRNSGQYKILAMKIIKFSNHWSSFAICKLSWSFRIMFLQSLWIVF